MNNKQAFGIANDLVNELVKKLDSNGSVDTGRLKNSISATIKNNTLIIEMVDYGKFIEFGTSPHIIRTKNKKVLSDGKNFFGKEVKHPGTRPAPFIRPTIHSKLKNIIIENINKNR